MTMTDPDPTIDRYIATWNETNPERRRDLIAQTWTEDASYLDPLMGAEGRDGIDAMIAGVQAQFPGYRFRRTGAVDAHHDRVRCATQSAFRPRRPAHSPGRPVPTPGVPG